MDKIKRVIRNDKIFFYLPVIIILFLSLFHLGKTRIINILGDEFGYWTSAAFFSGLVYHKLNNCYISFLNNM